MPELYTKWEDNQRALRQEYETILSKLQPGQEMRPDVHERFMELHRKTHLPPPLPPETIREVTQVLAMRMLFNDHNKEHLYDWLGYLPELEEKMRKTGIDPSDRAALQQYIEEHKEDMKGLIEQLMDSIHQYWPDAVLESSSSSS